MAGQLLTLISPSPCPSPSHQMMLSLLTYSLEYKNPSPIHTVNEAMEKCQSLTTSSELIFISIFLSLLALSSSHVSDFVSCLAASGVGNVTLFAQVDRDGAAAYYNLLNFSIQNLRFATWAVAKPAAIVLPANVEELAGTILCVREQGQWNVRIRSGGHRYEGLSSIADHKTICDCGHDDLAGFKSMSGPKPLG